MADASSIRWREGASERTGRWLSPGTAIPSDIGSADDGTTAAAALARARRGEGLVYGGDYRNARQLLAAMARRLERPARGSAGGRPRPSGPGLAPPAQASPAHAWEIERERRREAHDVLGRLLVPVEPGFRVPLARAPDASAALAEALAADAAPPGLLPLRDLLGMIGAHEWRRRGVEVSALGARVHPHFGVYAPVRSEYVDLVAAAASEWPAAGKRALDVGTGTGVLAFVLARAGAAVVATDAEPRAVACARENAARLGLDGRVVVKEADLWPEGEADLVVSNPPWLPGEAHGPLERAVYDPGGRFLERLVLELPAHLAPGGEAWIVLSDLAELLGLCPPDRVAALAARAGLRVSDVREARPLHPRARDRDDPFHAFRAREVTRLFRLVH
ncbi:MAG TPA: class I SAM-dependent methyltransferase [Anaeromyxobacter sp.]